MKKKLILLLLFVLTSMNIFLFAQRDERRRAEFEELNKKRVDFITKAMKLNTEEAKVFWPLYNELQEKKVDLNRQLRRTIFEFLGNEREKKTHTENEYKEIVNLVAQSKVKEAKLDEDYIAKFAKVISYEKIFLYQQAEQQFARQMLNQNRERGAERGSERQR